MYVYRDRDRDVYIYIYRYISCGVVALRVNNLATRFHESTKAIEQLHSGKDRQREKVETIMCVPNRI